jgi:hypothetical protein
MEAGSMSRRQRQTPEQRWKQALIEAYYDYRWHQVLDPLYEQMQRWKAGELTHADIDRAIHETHKQSQKLFTLFSERRDRLVALIQWDHEWFEPWVAEHPPPSGHATSDAARGGAPGATTEDRA